MGQFRRPRHGDSDDAWEVTTVNLARGLEATSLELDRATASSSLCRAVVFRCCRSDNLRGVGSELLSAQQLIGWSMEVIVPKNSCFVGTNGCDGLANIQKRVPSLYRGHSAVYICTHIKPAQHSHGSEL